MGKRDKKDKVQEIKKQLEQESDEESGEQEFEPGMDEEGEFEMFDSENGESEQELASDSDINYNQDDQEANKAGIEQSSSDDGDESEEAEGEEQINSSSAKQPQVNVGTKRELQPLPQQESSDDSEEDIIASTIKQKKQKKELSLQEMQKKYDLNKRQKKNENPEDNDIKQHQLPDNTERIRSGLTQGERDGSDRKELDIDFDYVTPSEPYFHMMRVLMQQYLDGEYQEKLDISGMVDSIISRASMGSVIASSLGDQDPVNNPEYNDLPDEDFEKICLKANQDRDVFGFISILSLTWSRLEDQWLNQILDYILQKGEKHCSKFDQMKQLLRTKNVGLLVNERLVNMTAELVPQLHTNMPDDVAFTKVQDDIKNPKEFSYDYLVVVSKFTIPNAEVKGYSRKNKLYYRWEDAVFEREAEFTFEYLSQFKEVADDGTKSYITGQCAQSGGGMETQFRLIYFISWQNYVKKGKELQAMINSKK